MMKRTFDSRESIEIVIDDLKKNYEEAKTMGFVNNPIAYALYHTWKKYDVNKKEVYRDESK